MLTAENNRLPSATKSVTKRIAAHLRWLEKELSRTDRDLDKAIKDSPALRENEALLRSVPSVGPVLARTLLASFLGLDDLHLFDGDAQGLPHVAEVGEVVESRLTFPGGERLFHGLLALEV